jgi:two-component system OmpR family response regulator
MASGGHFKVSVDALPPADRRMRAKRLLVVDDDPAMRDMVDTFLTERSFRVSTAADGKQMARVLEREPVDLIILDLKLEHEDGLELLRALPDQTRPPVIVLTGQARGEADTVLGLELGADDYVTKPVSLRELLARIRAVLRREKVAAERARRTEERVLYRFAGWVLDMHRRLLTSPAGEPVTLTPGEFNLLVAFLRAPQQILSRDQLLAATRGHDDEVFDRSIDVQILRLRRKLEVNASDPQLIRTERSVGYVFTAPVAVG